jgi:succinoglycan biosynthesis transport protein ExoP
MATTRDVADRFAHDLEPRGEELMVDGPMHRAPLGPPREHFLLRVYARWILTVVLVAVAGSCLLSWALTDPAYVSEARVLVNPGSTPGGAPLMPDMETERQVVVSEAVTSDAASSTGTSAPRLQRRLTVTVPADSTVLVLRYADTTAADAQRRAQAVADSYAAYRSPQTAILSPADRPRSATGPNYLVTAAAGLALGLLLGVGSALLRDRLDDRVRGPKDLVEHTDLPVLATVPLPAAHGDGGGRDDEIVVLDTPGSPAAEALRQLRGKIARATRGRHRTTVVTLVTSATRDESAAYVAANTAVALAMSGARVLLVDADLREPRLAGLLDGPADGGLGGVLVGAVPLTAAVRTTRVNGLRLLPAGVDVPLDPGDLLDERAVEKALSEIPVDVDHVLVSAPPVLTAAETSAMAEHAHLLVMVVTTGRTRRQDLRSAVTELGAAPAALLGGVLCEGAPRQRRSMRLHRREPTAAPARSAPGDVPRAQGPSEDVHETSGAPTDHVDHISRAG